MRVCDHGVCLHAFEMVLSRAVCSRILRWCDNIGISMFVWLRLIVQFVALTVGCVVGRERDV